MPDGIQQGQLTDSENIILLTYTMRDLIKSLDELKVGFGVIRDAAVIMRIDRLERLVWGTLVAVGLETLTLLGGLVKWSLTSQIH